MIAPRIVTIGVYGFDEEDFFAALHGAGVDLFCDIRQRRGVRGSRYAFANSQRLQDRLTEMGIRYVHTKELAPAKELRQTQYAADQSQKTAKRQRTVLDPAFVSAYRRHYLAEFSTEDFLNSLPQDTKVIVLFCVERAPEACHRSLVAEKLAQDAGLKVEHIR